MKINSKQLKNIFKIRNEKEKINTPSYYINSNENIIHVSTYFYINAICLDDNFNLIGLLEVNNNIIKEIRKLKGYVNIIEDIEKEQIIINENIIINVNTDIPDNMGPVFKKLLQNNALNKITVNNKLFTNIKKFKEYFKVRIIITDPAIELYFYKKNESEDAVKLKYTNEEPGNGEIDITVNINYLIKNTYPIGSSQKYNLVVYANGNNKVLYVFNTETHATGALIALTN